MINFIFNFETYLYSWIALLCIIPSVSYFKILSDPKVSGLEGVLSLLGAISIFIAPVLTIPLIVTYEVLYHIRNINKKSEASKQSKSTEPKNVKFTLKIFDKKDILGKLELLLENFGDGGYSSYNASHFDRIGKKIYEIKNMFVKIKDNYPKLESISSKLIDVALTYVATLTVDESLELYKKGNTNQRASTEIIQVLDECLTKLDTLIREEKLRIAKEKEALIEISMKQYSEAKNSVLKSMDALTKVKGE